MATRWVTAYTDGTFANTKLNLFADLNTLCLSLYKALDAMKYGYAALPISDQRESGETYTGTTRPALFTNHNGEPNALSFEYALSRTEYAGWMWEVPNDCTSDSAITLELKFKPGIATEEASIPMVLKSFAKNAEDTIHNESYTTTTTVDFKTESAYELTTVSAALCSATAGQIIYMQLERICESTTQGEYLYTIPLIGATVKYERKYTA